MAKEDDLDVNLPPDTTNMGTDEFFRAHLYKQMIDANAGSTTIMQALVGKLGEKVIEDGDTNGAIKSMSDLNDLTKTMQLNTIEIMSSLKKLD